MDTIKKHLEDSKTLKYVTKNLTLGELLKMY